MPSLNFKVMKKKKSPHSLHRIVHGSLRSTVCAAVELLAAVRILKSRARYFENARAQSSPTIDASATFVLVEALTNFIRAHDGMTPAKAARKELFSSLVGRHFKIGGRKEKTFKSVKSVEFSNGKSPVALFDDGTRRDAYYLARCGIETDGAGNEIPLSETFRHKYFFH